MSFCCPLQWLWGCVSPRAAGNTDGRIIYVCGKTGVYVLTTELPPACTSGPPKSVFRRSSAAYLIANGEPSRRCTVQHSSRSVALWSPVPVPVKVRRCGAARYRCKYPRIPAACAWGWLGGSGMQTPAQRGRVGWPSHYVPGGRVFRQGRKVSDGLHRLDKIGESFLLP